MLYVFRYATKVHNIPFTCKCFKFFLQNICNIQILSLPLRPQEAQMAESVDALVSNTSGATRAGSTPALGTRLKCEECCKFLSYSTLLGNVPL